MKLAAGLIQSMFLKSSAKSYYSFPSFLLLPLKQSESGIFTDTTEVRKHTYKTSTLFKRFFMWSSCISKDTGKTVRKYVAKIKLTGKTIIEKENKIAISSYQILFFGSICDLKERCWKTWNKLSTLLFKINYYIIINYCYMLIIILFTHLT